MVQRKAVARSGGVRSESLAMGHRFQAMGRAVRPHCPVAGQVGSRLPVGIRFSSMLNSAR
ncbi:hypothetical protein C7C46_18685 [Streptomyces tateyamensis]|uniref:Uncharacterized protein n=1 Tax=Streptomyces tateyamensis TaxID=565073 RepID=A0A2V4N0U1_9ACTN|nr:hypothetical protein C7C46_18685 [Streptomyces tateyamensis]